MMAAEINDQPLLYYRARVTFAGEQPIDIFPTLTNDPAGFRRGLSLNYSEAERIQVWECSADGSPVEPTAETKEAGETEGAFTHKTKARSQTAKRASSLAQFY